MNQVILLLGSNIEPRLTFLQKAEYKLSDSIGNILKLSMVYESDPWGFEANQRFLNRVVILETDLSAQPLLSRVLAIEKELGRERLVKGYSSRKIDIDILYYSELQIAEPDLVIPHPGIPDRRFVLVPLTEVAGSFVHPVLKKSNASLLEQCGDKSNVRIYEV